MIHCAYCGAVISDDSVFCGTCGKETGQNAGLSAEESIALARDLAQKYDRRDWLMSQISNCETEIERNKSRITGARYSTFRFFWPFLILSQVATLIMAVIWGLVAGIAGNRGLLDYTNIVCFLAMVATIIIGYAVACHIRDKRNGEIYRAEDKIRYDRKRFEDELEGYKSELNRINISLKDFDRLIPATMRRKEVMAKIASVLESGEASDFNQALSLCSRR